jgi:cyclophilin family peptidyl-prolyl cis-trans isomerase
MKAKLLFILILNVKILIAQKHKVEFITNFGNFKVLLYDNTPKHRDLFLNAIQDTTYKNAFFNRIIKDFVVQGGEHDVDIAQREAKNLTIPKKRLAGEFPLKNIHKMGALGAGRDDNPEKASFLNQIYFVVGKSITPEDIQKVESKKNIKYTKKQRKSYILNGGLPRLDYDYTVFGEVYYGLDVLLKISQVKTDSLNYPIIPIHFEVKSTN